MVISFLGIKVYVFVGKVVEVFFCSSFCFGERGDGGRDAGYL